MWPAYADVSCSVSLLGSLTLILLALIVWYMTHRGKPSDLPPCYGGWIPWLGCALEFGKDPLHFIDRARHKYGPVFTLRVAGKRMTFLTEADDFKHFFQSGCADFQMAVQEPVRNTASITPEAFYRSHTTVHDAVKGCLAPSLLHPFSRSLCNSFSSLIQEWGASGSWELNSLVRTTMYKGVLDSLFGYNVLHNHEDMYEDFEKHFVRFDENFEYGSQLPEIFLKEWRESKWWLLKFFRRVVTENLRNGAQPDTHQPQTVFETVIRTVDRPYAPNFALLMMWASLANAIPITFWTLAFILSHPGVYRDLTQEVDNVLKSRQGEEVTLDEDDLRKLPKVKAAILEAIRLRSPGAIARGVKKPFTVKGYTVPTGDLLLMSPYWAHRNETLFPEPEKFKPERWEAANLDKNVFLDGFVAFGGGRYQCPGRWFALLDIHIFVAMVIHHYDLQLLDPVPKNSPLHLVGTQQPVGPCAVRFSRRC